MDERKDELDKVIRWPVFEIFQFAEQNEDNLYLTVRNWKQKYAFEVNVIY